MNTKTAIFLLLAILCVSCGESIHDRQPSMRKHAGSNTIWKCSVTGYNECEFVVQRPNLYIKGSSEACSKELDSISTEYYKTCDSVVVYKEQLNVIEAK